MRIALLGPVQAYAADGTPIEVSAARLRTLLARLALAVGETVSSEALIDDLWGHNPPTDALNALHALIYRLRKALRDPGALESAGVGYRLAVAPENVDIRQFEHLATRGRRELSTGAPQQAATLLGEALNLWRGTALADVREAPFADAAAVRLEELRAVVLEDRFEAELRLGHHAEILADLTAASADHPLRERLAALRMRALSAAGRQSDALAAYEEVRSRLADELGVDPSADVREAHLAVLRGSVERPELTPGRLPARLTSFTGRDDELKLVAELLDSSRLVTVVGPGGVGKTSLAIKTATQHRTYRQGRLWLVSLVGSKSVAEAVLGALNSPNARPPGTGPAEPLNRVVELLGVSEAVLILDNCEHIVDAVAQFAREVLERQPELTILATSREPLEVMGEALCRLGPLDESPAVQLFVDRAMAARPGFRLDESTMDHVVDVVRRLDGLPLALELAAARLRSMSVQQIAQRLDDRFRLLKSGNRAADPRQRTLHAVIDWSWDLLTGQEQLLARRMSVFPTSSSADAIEAVCGGEDITALVDKSIVEETATGYRMLESIRAYMAEKLVPERDEVLRRFARYFADLAERHEPLLRSAKQDESLKLFETEYDNLIFALQTAVDARDAITASRLLTPLCWYWSMPRYDARAETFVAQLLEFGDALPEVDQVAFRAFQLVTGTGPAPDDAELVRELIEDCARTGALRRYPMSMVATLGTGYMLGLDDLVEQEIRKIRAGTDPWARACTYLVEAFARYFKGDWQGVATSTQQALQGFEETGDRLFIATVLAGVAHISTTNGDHEAAIRAYERAVALATPNQWEYLVGLANERMRAGDLPGARRELDRAGYESGQRLIDAVVAQAKADLLRRCGDIDGSDRELDRSLTYARDTPMPEEAAHNMITPARMANRLAAGDIPGARALLPSLISVTSGNLDLPMAAQSLARLRYLEGDLTGAATALGMSEAIRGVFDKGDPELRDLVADLVNHLGQDAYDQAYGQGAQMPRQDAMDTLMKPVSGL
ncbi:winged helix-turn-helix domain-containing protein [Kibdelosporangium philippinense]|uniref:Winged helix-turn-helix domain-containing protein n=1 Tax=Kibdelosporangium philippinense TaxID=211113 RepID=A0ABS8ZTN1_9PSEU|nr:BTAD domain-containing putative transcriptional regulator [Kibdelosporangium philippinense]MCE7010944.1 winged helix-turn-helix domain-containing protein [Kibdelosporangium philippinense]